MNTTGIPADHVATYARPDTVLVYVMFVFAVCVVLWINVEGISRIFKVITCIAGARLIFLIYTMSNHIQLHDMIFLHLFLIALQISSATWLFLMNLKYAPARMISLVVYSLMTMVLISIGLTGDQDCYFFLVMGLISVMVQSYFVIQNNIQEVNQGTDELPAAAGWYPVLMSAAYVYMFWRSPVCSDDNGQYVLSIFVIDIVQTCVFMTFVSLRVHMAVDSALFEINSEAVL